MTGVKVGGQLLELDRVYTLASHNYMLKSGGDGYTMFQGCTLLKDETVLDNQALIRYLGQILEGDLSAYSAPGGQGRIQIAETAEETGGAPAEPEEPAAGARIYVVQPGDCLWTIAWQELGGGLRWVEIYDANRDQIQDPDRIQAGMELELPARRSGARPRSCEMDQSGRRAGARHELRPSCDHDIDGSYDSGTQLFGWDSFF